MVSGRSRFRSHLRFFIRCFLTVPRPKPKPTERAGADCSAIIVADNPHRRPRDDGLLATKVGFSLSVLTEPWPLPAKKFKIKLDEAGPSRATDAAAEPPHRENQSQIKADVGMMSKPNRSSGVGHSCWPGSLCMTGPHCKLAELSVEKESWFESRCQLSGIEPVTHAAG